MRNDQQCSHILCRRPCSWEQYIQWRWPFSNLQPTFGYTYIFVNQFQSLEISIKFWTAKMSLCSQACEHADTSNFLEMPFTYVLQKKIFFKLHNVCKFVYRHLYTSPSLYIKQSGIAFTVIFSIWFMNFHHFHRIKYFIYHHYQAPCQLKPCHVSPISWPPTECKFMCQYFPCNNKSLSVIFSFRLPVSLFL